MGMYPHVFVAGTFDRLHDGHKSFLSRAFATGDRVTIGLTSDEFVARFKNGGHKYLPFIEREKHLDAWISAHDFANRTTVIPIDDPYEPAASMEDLDAILVTSDNWGRGEEINKRRAGKGLAPLTLVEAPLVPAEDRKPISATRIANGEIDHAGRLIMPDNLRPELVKPLGDVLTGDAIGSSIEKNRSGIIITVGDVTTKTLLTAGVTPSLTIVDFHVGRKLAPELDARLAGLNLFRVNIKSGPGYIAEEAIDFIKKWSSHPNDKTVLVIDGEEDLLTLPAVSYGPVGSIVYYGQPEKGLVEVYTDKKRDDAAMLLAKFAVK